METKKQEIRKQLQEIFNYAELIYSQPRDSKQDNWAFIKITDDIGKLIKNIFGQ